MSGDHVSCSRKCLHFTDGCDEACVFVCVGFDCNDPVRGCGHGVVPQMHGGGPGVVGLACEGELHASLADQSFDNS